MANAVVIAILALVLFPVVRYLYKAKKRGEHCVGCPYARECSAAAKARCSENAKSNM
ncbi:MAG: FeoB-associated Cys-rich membrane protein [Clostridia bacterium]|nr:FeoB-associated Cys-rich membrane protein [Clostridia bacterium]